MSEIKEMTFMDYIEDVIYQINNYLKIEERLIDKAIKQIDKRFAKLECDQEEVNIIMKHRIFLTGLLKEIRS